ncbi:uncharacterized protein LOC131859358 [Cryptomeria japonica]|uniref:uncharacterized protein LOC131859358 n=1 Tax=Cryptomeria japonica TaxID=3369 RepID=UPI0027DA8225|nr:uncharacterized protein LOC131859358 [Cryptomeria japonica]
MGYEVDGNTLDAYSQHLLSKLVDQKEEKFGTDKEKDLDLHKKFTESRRKRKVKKEVEELAEQMGITKVVQRDREHNILKEEDMNHVPPPKPQANSTGATKKRKKEKPQREYVAPTTKDVETKFDEAVREVKKIATYARVVKKPQSSRAQPTKKPRTEAEQYGRPKSSRKSKSKLDEALKSGKVEGTYDVRAIKEVVVQYMNVYSKAFIQLSSMIPKGLYDILDARRHIDHLEDERIKEYILVNLSYIVSKVEVDRFLKLAKDRFRSKKRVNKIMREKIDEVVKETGPTKKAILAGHTNEQSIVVDDTDTTKVDNSGEAEQNPLVIGVDSKKAVEEIGKVDEGKEEVDDKNEEETSVENAQKEKGEEKGDQALVIVERDTDKGK